MISSAAAADRFGRGVVLAAPAKLNLSLAVLARRADGYHDIESLMVPLSLHDVLRVRGRDDGRVTLALESTAGPAAGIRTVPADETNLAVRAVRRLAAAAGEPRGLDIELVKRIPAGGGLGGGSSDAAAAILAAAWVWGIDWPRSRLADIGAEIGSDVPWFFAARPAIVRGRGEAVEPVPPLPPLWAVVACPDAGLSTAAVYARCTPDAASRGEAARLAAALAGGGLRAAAPLLVNALEPPARALCPEVDGLLEALARCGGVAPRMTGSGSSCFTLARTAAEARGIAGRLRAERSPRGPRWSAVFTAALALPPGAVRPARPAEAA